MKTPAHVLTGVVPYAFCVALSLPVGAQTTDSAAAGPAQSAGFPCEAQPEFREFDFWVGEWDVHTADGTLAGRNVIESSHRGCVLIENWTGAGGSTGTSMNYYDAAAGEWVQVWADASGSQITIRGGLTDAGMLLEGQIHYTATGITAPFRGLWTPQSDGRVRQFFEQSNDEGKSWVPWFEGYYSRARSGNTDDGSG